MTKRRRRRKQTAFVELSVTLGAAVGLALAANHALLRKTTSPCPPQEKAAACLNHATSAAVGHYVTSALAGALIGLGVLMALVLLRRNLPKAARALRRRRGGVLPVGDLRRSTAMPQTSSRPTAAAPAGSLGGVKPELTTAERRELRRKARLAVLDALRAMGGEGTRGAVIARALQLGGFSVRELAAPSPAAKYPHMIAHDLSWALTDLKRDGLVENPRWSTWRLTSSATVASEPAIPEPIPGWRLAELRTMPYREYLRTPEWRRARAAALVRAGFCCALDPAHVENLEVHHRTYERLGAEHADDLLVLCQDCHQLHHKSNGRPHR